MNLSQQQTDIHASAFAFVRAPSFEMLPMYDRQKEIVNAKSRFTICEATTKAGKTFSHIEWLLFKASEIRRGNVWWVAPVSDQADIAFRRTQDRLRGVIDSKGELEKVGDPIPFTVNIQRHYIRVFGCTIWFKSADKPASLYGEDVYAAVCDEITHWKEPSWHAVRTTLTATRGPAKLIGNVRGKRNFAYKLARAAETGKQDWLWFKLTAGDAIEGGVFPEEELRQAEIDFADRPEVFRELYWAEASDDGANPFGEQWIRAALMDHESPDATVVYGLDLGRKQDYTWLIGLDPNGFMTESDRFQLPWKECVQRVGDIVGDLPVVVDATGVGDPIYERLLENGVRTIPYVYTSKSKQILMEGLAAAFQYSEVGIFGDILMTELLSFEFEYTRTGVRYVCPTGMHDDGVNSLALARHGLKHGAYLSEDYEPAA